MAAQPGSGGGARSPVGRNTQGLPFRLIARLGSEAAPVGATGTVCRGPWCWPALLSALAGTCRVDQRRPLLGPLLTLPAPPVLGPCTQEPIWGCIPCLSEPLGHPFPLSGHRSSDLDPQPWSGRIQLRSWTQPIPLPTQAFSSVSGPGVQAEFLEGQAAPAPCHLGAVPPELWSCPPPWGCAHPRPGPAGFKPRCPGASVPRDCITPELGPPSLPALSRPRGPSEPAAPRERRGGWTEEGKKTAPPKGPTPTIATVTSNVSVPGNSPQ